jgi:hypothetical protein
MLAAAAAEENAYAKFFCHFVLYCRSKGWGGDRSEVYSHVPKAGHGAPIFSTQCSRTGVHRIFFPNAEHASSTARSAVRLCSSITGFTSTISKLSMRP